MQKELINKILEKKEVFSKGKRGIIYTSTIDNKTYLIKQRNPKSKSPGTIQNEFEYNQKLNKIKIGPKIYYYDKKQDFLIRDFVKGKKIEDWVKENKQTKDFKQNLIKILKQILLQCKKLDEIKINKQELTNPHKDILITNQNKPTIIDFERCRHTLKPKNVTQFMQYLTRPFMKKTLGLQDINLDKKQIIELSEKYKKNQTKENFTFLLKIISQT
ncbi:MAG: hypothetical protein ACMXX7_01650 [Candidatus Woesearchaeota archaeon]